MFTMLVSLYTTRVVLQMLGIEDFGIYTIVGGMVALFAFLNGAMTTSTQRFLSFELGKNDLVEMKRVFNMSMNVHIIIALTIILLAETVGLWFLNTKMDIPSERLVAANWVYQFSLFTFCMRILRTPYQASVVSYEKFSFYAYIGVLETMLTLFAVLSLFLVHTDKLIIYALLIFVVNIGLYLSYWVYCRLKYDICRYNFFFDKSLFLKLMGFSGWNFLGSLSNVSAQQGLNILLNLFFGIIANAAVGITNQVTTAVNSFLFNFQLAYNPQIVKSYAIGDKAYFMRLVFQMSKYTYFLMLVISLPLLIKMDFVLHTWLGDVPEYAIIFCRLMLIYCLIDAIMAPLWIAVQAIGNIRNNQIIIAILVFLNLPCSFLALKWGFSPETVFYIRIVVNLMTFCYRIIYLHSKVQLPVWKYIREVILVALIVTVLAVILLLFIQYHTNDDWIGFVQLSLLSVLITGIIIYFIGLSYNEKKYLKYIVLSRIKK
jgi:O-antigen/teichoic acid export membrane protein